MSDRALFATFALTVLFAASGGAAQDSETQIDPLTAEEALENADDLYRAADMQTVQLCPQGQEQATEGESGNVIVVCRQLGPANPFQTRDGPQPRMDRTADGAPRAPDVSGLPPCTAICIKGLGWAPPPVLIIDLTKLPEPLAPEDAARVFRAPDAQESAPAPLTGERIPIPIDDPPIDASPD